MRLLVLVHITLSSVVLSNTGCRSAQTGAPVTAASPQLHVGSCRGSAPAPAGVPEVLARKAEYLGIAYDNASAAAFKAALPGCGAVVSEHVAKAPGNGGVSIAHVFVARQPIQLWRVWGGEAGDFGSWWSFVRPAGTTAQWRREYGVCVTYNDATRLLRCTLLAGAVFAAGPGAEVSCKGGEQLPASETWQVYLDTFNRSARELSALLDCDGLWPLNGTELSSVSP